MASAPDLAQLTEKLQAYVGAKRIGHSLNTAQAARELAERHAPQLAEKAALAGLLHDHAKRMSDAELIATAKRLDIEVSPGEHRWPALLHGKIGAALIAERFGVKDAEISQAVADHVTGRPNMGILSLILYVADQAAADREFPGVQELRQVAETDLKRAAFLVAKHKLRYVLSRERLIDPTTIAVYNELRSACQESADE